MDTLRENTTIRETPPPSLTIVEGENITEEPSHHNSGAFGQLQAFRDYVVIRPLPTQGAEADLYLVQRDAAQSVLKLYRNTLAPKPEVLNKIQKLSEANREHLVHILETGFDPASDRWFEVMEFLPHGSLQTLRLGSVNREQLVQALLHDLAGALNLLHQNNIVHCDLKPSNVLVRALAPFDLVLTDFGISSQMIADVSIKATSLKGTPLYWAPEAFSSLISHTADWWALGVIALEILMGKHPFADLSQQQITYELTVNNIDVPLSLGRLSTPLRGLLTKDRTKRWGYSELLRWLRGEKEIPVYYQNTSLKRTQTEEKAFRFNDEELFSLEQIAISFNRNETTWELAQRYLPYVRPWLEERLEFDAAIAFVNEMERFSDPHLQLFHFVHAHAILPFSYMGIELNTQNVLELILRAGRGSQDISAAEQVILLRFEDRSIIDLFMDYTAYRKETDVFFQRLLTFLCSVDTAMRHEYAFALIHPEEHLWPIDAGREGLNALRKMSCVPIRHSVYAEWNNRYALPLFLVKQLESSHSYNEALNQLRALERDCLLLKKENGVLSDQTDIPLDNIERYISVARRKNWGLNDTLAADIARICVALTSEAKRAQAVSSENVLIHRLQEIKDRCVNERDTALVATTKTELLYLKEQNKTLRHEILREQTPLCLFTFLASLFLLFPASDQTVLRVALFFSLAIAFLACFCFDIWRWSHTPREGAFGRGAIPSVTLILVFIVASFGNSSRWFAPFTPITHYYMESAPPSPTDQTFWDYLYRYLPTINLFRLSLVALLLLWVSLRIYRLYRTRRKELFTNMLRRLLEFSEA